MRCGTLCDRKRQKGCSNSYDKQRKPARVHKRNIIAFILFFFLREWNPFVLFPETFSPPIGKFHVKFFFSYQKNDRAAYLLKFFNENRPNNRKVRYVWPKLPAPLIRDSRWRIRGRDKRTNEYLHISASLSIGCMVYRRSLGKQWLARHTRCMCERVKKKKKKKKDTKNAAREIKERKRVFHFLDKTLETRHTLVSVGSVRG